MHKEDDPWKAKLTPEQYHVLRESGTERPFTGKLLHNKEKGSYHCAACDALLFDSSTKFDSGSGWPSFWQAASRDAIALHTDKSLGMIRTEATCASCGSHLGHVFPDGPQPTGDRFCMNSVSLSFKGSDNH